MTEPSKASEHVALGGAGVGNGRGRGRRNGKRIEGLLGEEGRRVFLSDNGFQNLSRPRGPAAILSIPRDTCSTLTAAISA